MISNAFFENISLLSKLYIALQVVLEGGAELLRHVSTQRGLCERESFLEENNSLTLTRLFLG